MGLNEGRSGRDAKAGLVGELFLRSNCQEVNGEEEGSMKDDPVFWHRRGGRGNSNVSHFPALRSKQLVTLSGVWSGLYQTVPDIPVDQAELQ